MERRDEPRFPITSPVKVTVLGKPDREMECLLIEISARGMRLVVEQSIHEDEILALEMEDHLVVAVVRNKQSRGDKYAIGAERIHAVDRGALSSEKPKGEQVRALLREKGWAIETETVESIIGQEAPAKEQVAPPKETVGETLNLPKLTPAPSRSWRVPIAVGASLAIAILAVVYFLEFRSRAGTGDSHPNRVAAAVPAATKPSEPVAPAAPLETKTPEPVAPAARVEAKEPAPAEPVQPPSRDPSEKRHVEIKAEETSWVAATVDGKPALAEVVAKGGTREFDFSRVARVRVGTAGGVNITVDGKSVGPLGRPGQLRMFDLMLDGIHFLPWTNTDAVNQSSEP
jgi:hypothetical protein